MQNIACAITGHINCSATALKNRRFMNVNYLARWQLANSSFMWHLPNTHLNISAGTIHSDGTPAQRHHHSALALFLEHIRKLKGFDPASPNSPDPSPIMLSLDALEQALFTVNFPVTDTTGYPMRSQSIPSCVTAVLAAYTISGSNILADMCRNKKEIRDKHRIRLTLCQKQRYA